MDDTQYLTQTESPTGIFSIVGSRTKREIIEMYTGETQYVKDFVHNET